jgi:hypothetical protein
VKKYSICKLNLAARKLLVESKEDDDIIVNRVPEDKSYKDPLAFSRKGKQTPGLHTYNVLNINPEILNKFIDEGKIKGLNNNSSKCSD